MRFHSSIGQSLGKIRKNWPRAELAAFGQTPFWDEPMKSVLVPMLDAHHPEATMLVGPHDADYFGKCPGLRSAERFVVCEHNDGPTREIWAAVGEMSALFGAEKVPTRSVLAERGVQVETLLRVDRQRYENLIDAYTTAWGWRGLVEAGGGNTVARDVPAAEVGGVLRDLLEWAADETTSLIDLSQLDHRSKAKDFVASAAALLTGAGFETLTDLFKAYWPIPYLSLLGDEPERVEVTSTSEVFQFNRRTCRRPRFRLVGHFLNPKTAAVCREAYSDAVTGSGMYELDRFGHGALPFDLVVPGRGRGTISLGDDHLVVDTDPHIVVDLASPVRSVTALAAAIEDALGPDVSLVGKAVALAYMITSEFVFVLNEEGSVYVPRTREMARRMADALRDKEKLLKAELSKLQRLHGKMSRIVKPLRDRLEELEKTKAPSAEIEQARMELACYRDGEIPDLDEKLGGHQEELREVQTKRKRVVAEYRSLERGPQAKATRKRLAAVEAEAEAARLRMAANAYRVVESLPYTNHRPSAWWLPVVDPTGGWYRAVLESTELAVEEMV